MEGVHGKEVTDGDLVVLVVFGQLEHDVSGYSWAGSHDVETHFVIILIFDDDYLRSDDNYLRFDDYYYPLMD